MKCPPLVASLTGLLLAACGTGADPVRGDVPREAEYATEYIVWDLALEKSQSVRAVRDRCGDYCDDNGAGIEVAIDLLGVGGDATTASLLNLLSIGLDAGASESRSCQIAKRGRALVPALKAFDSTKAAHWCQTTFNRLRKRELSEINDVRVEDMCRPIAEIEKDRQEWVAALNSGRDLFAESGPC